MIVVACFLLTAALLGYVFVAGVEEPATPEKTRLIYLRERKDVIYENLRDLNFEYKAGKFPDADYEAMRTSLEEEAAGVLAEISELEK
jgi:hypothetical protein